MKPFLISSKKSPEGFLRGRLAKQIAHIDTEEKVDSYFRTEVEFEKAHTVILPPGTNYRYD